MPKIAEYINTNAMDCARPKAVSFLLQDPMGEIVAMFWMIFQPLLFGLIGAEVNIAQIDGGTVGRLL